MNQHQTLSKKQQVLQQLFEECQQKGSMEFTNDDVKRIAQEVGFANPFDVTKVDESKILPPDVRTEGYCVIHTGRGTHKFIRGLTQWYHSFEPIEDRDIIDWRYRKSLLNDLDTGEASVISFVFNQHILHDFLCEDVVASPKIYTPGRTRADLDYAVGTIRVNANNQQMEIDLTMEYLGTITVIEAKNRFIDDFAIYQLFHPVKYYLQRAQSLGLPIKEVNACYILKQSSRNQLTQTSIRLYLYRFRNPDRLESIKLVRKAEYRLQRR